MNKYFVEPEAINPDDELTVINRLKKYYNVDPTLDHICYAHSTINKIIKLLGIAKCIIQEETIKILVYKTRNIYHAYSSSQHLQKHVHEVASVDEIFGYPESQDKLYFIFKSVLDNDGITEYTRLKEEHKNYKVQSDQACKCIIFLSENSIKSSRDLSSS